MNTLVAALLCLIAQATPLTSSIEGTVLDAVTDRPIRNATVYAVSGNSQPKSDDSGHFRLQGLQPGRQRIRVSAEGYGTGILAREITLDVDSAQMKDLTLRLQSAGIITGQVINARGQPVVNATLRLMLYRFEPGYTGSQAMSTALTDLDRAQTFLRPYTTDDQGRFRILDIPSGNYYLRIEPSREDQFTAGLGATFYPGGVGASRAERIRVSGGSESRLSPVILSAPTLGSIRVHIVDTAGESPSLKTPDDISIRNLSTGLTESSGMRPGETGSIRPSEAGKYLVCSSRHVEETGPSRTDQDPSGALILNRHGCVSVQYDGGDLDVTITLEKPNGHLSARLTLEDADAASSEDFELGIRGLMDNRPDTFMYTLKTDNLLRSPYGVPLPIRYAGRAGLLAMTPSFRFPDYYVASVSQGSRDVLVDGFEIFPDTDSPLDIVVSAAGGSLRGKVIDSVGKPVLFAEIALVPQGALAARSDRATSFRTTQTDQNGAYEFRGLIPGDYRAYAVPTLNGFAFWDEAVTEPFNGVAKTIHVEKGSRISADLNLLIIPAQ